MDQELTAKPCPFCGGTIDVENEIYFLETDGTKWGAVQCGVCCGRGPEVRTGYKSWTTWKEAALKEWNQRYKPTFDPLQDADID